MKNFSEFCADGLAAVEDPNKRARAAGELLADLQAAVAEVSRIRRAAVLEMVNAGMSYRQIGSEINITTQRVGQIVNARTVAVIDVGEQDRYEAAADVYDVIERGAQDPDARGRRVELGGRSPLSAQ